MRLIMSVWLGLISLALALLTAGFAVDILPRAASLGAALALSGVTVAGVAGTVLIAGLALSILVED